MKNIDYKPEIDGLRAFAVLSVLFYHLGFSWMPGGFLGVDIFFVISGYLITGILIKELRAENFSLSNFYARRIKRIFPALIFVLFGCGVMAFLFHGPSAYLETFKAIKFSALQISNFYFMKEVDYFDQGLGASPLLHTWSLGVEEQFYLFWPLILLILYKTLGAGRSFILAVSALFLISLGISEYFVKNDPMQAFYMLYSRAWELLLGGSLALGIFPHLKKKWSADALSIVAVALLVFTVCFYSTADFPGLKAFLPCFAAALFIYSAQHHKGIMHRAFSLKPVVFIGLISYSMYLWHWPFIRFYDSYTALDMTLNVKLALICATIVMAYISYRFVEQPFRHIKTSPKKVIAIGLITILVIAFSTNLFKRGFDSTWRVTEAIDGRMFAQSPLVRQCKGADFTNGERCTIGEETAKKKALLIGDSHAGYYSDMLKLWAEENDVTFDMVVRTGKGLWFYPFDESDTNSIQKVGADQQAARLEFNKFVKQQKENNIQYDYAFLAIRSDQIYDYYKNLSEDKTVVNKAFERDAQKGYDTIKPIAKQIVILGQVPPFKNEPLDCYYKAHLLVSSFLKTNDNAQECIKLDKEYSKNAIDPGKNILAKNRIYFDPAPSIYGILEDKDKIFPYSDKHHLNPTGATFLLEPFSTFMKKQKKNK